jgi:hypothetical protein
VRERKRKGLGTGYNLWVFFPPFIIVLGVAWVLKTFILPNYHHKIISWCPTGIKVLIPICLGIKDTLCVCTCIMNYSVCIYTM